MPTGKLKAAEKSRLEQEQRVWDSMLERFSTDFFLQIPAADTAAIATEEEIASKTAMLNMLSDIALTQKLLKQKQKQPGGLAAAGAAAKVEPHPLDEKYSSLACRMSAVPVCANASKLSPARPQAAQPPPAVACANSRLLR